MTLAGAHLVGSAAAFTLALLTLLPGGELPAVLWLTAAAPALDCNAIDVSVFSPNRTRWSKHSDFADSTQRSAWALRFGLRGGRANGLTPTSLRVLRNLGQYFPSRS